MEAYGERQVSGTLEGIREDHKQRYLWALDRIEHAGLLLDAGCGVGYGSHLLSQKADHVIGLDISRESIDYANRYWKKDNITFDTANLHFLHFDPSHPKFDVVVCFECIEHLVIPDLFLLRLRPYLADNAQLFLSVPNESVHPFQILRNPYHVMHYTQSDLKDLLNRTGFELAAELASQNDVEVFPGIEGRFLLAQCKCAAVEPASNIAALEAQLLPRMQTHFIRMGNELAIVAGVKAERDRLKDRLSVSEKDLLVAQSKLAGEGALRGDINLFRQELEGVKKQQQELAKAKQELTKAQQELIKTQQEAAKNRQELARSIQHCEAQQRTFDKRFQEVWQHPAIRRLARFNWFGLKLLGALGSRASNDTANKAGTRGNESE